MKRITGKIGVLLLAGVLATTSLGLVGCGGSDTSDADEAKGAGTTTAQPADDKEQPATTPAAQEEKPQTVTMYTLANLTLRTSGSKEAEVVCIIPIGSKVKVSDTSNAQWFKLSYDGKKGYASSDYLTKSKKKAAKAKEDAEAAAAAQEQQSQSSTKASDYNDGSSSGKTVVSREKFDDCDGSGHGYEQITYSDGSTEIIEY